MILAVLAFFRSVPSRIWIIMGYIVLALSLFVGVRHSGRIAERLETKEKKVKAYEKANEIRRDIDSLPDADVRKRLRKYQRD